MSDTNRNNQSKKWTLSSIEQVRFGLARKKCATLLAIAICVLIQSPAQADEILDIDGARDKHIQPIINQKVFHASRIDTETFEILAYTGAYKYEGFDSRPIVGIKTAYHFSETLFVELDYANTAISGYVIPLDTSTLVDESVNNFDISFGFNFMRGQIFIGNNKTISSNTYLKYGVGRSKIAESSNSLKTIDLGIRLLLPNDKTSIQFGVNQDTVSAGGDLGSAKNLKVFTGIGVYF